MFRNALRSVSACPLPLHISMLLGLHIPAALAVQISRADLSSEPLTVQIPADNYGEPQGAGEGYWAS